MKSSFCLPHLHLDKQWIWTTIILHILAGFQRLTGFSLIHRIHGTLHCRCFLLIQSCFFGFVQLVIPQHDTRVHGMNKLLSSGGSFSGHRGPSKCLKENHSYASLHQFFLEESIFPIFCSQTANKRTNPLLLHLQEKRNQTGNPLTKSAKSDSLYMENNSSDSPWRIILSNKSSQDKIACPSWIQGFLGLLLCISSMSFAHTGRVRQHKYCHTDYCSCTIWASIHFSFCTSPLWFYWEISAISYLQRQHKSFTKPSHVYSYCAKLSPGVSTCNSQL